MKVRTLSNELSEIEAELIIVGAFENEIPYGGPELGGVGACLGTYSELTDLTGGHVLIDQAIVERFHGKVGETLVHLNCGALKAPRVLMVGLGVRNEFNLAVLRKALTSAFKLVKVLKVSHVAIVPVAGEVDYVGGELYGQAVATYAGLVDYVINHRKTAQGGHKAEARLQKVTVLNTALHHEEIKHGLKTGRVIAEAVNRARDLSNMPASDLTPRKLACVAKEIADASGGAIECKVLGRKKLEHLGAHALLAVSRGSVEEPQLIELTYSPKRKAADEVLALVGKSVTFDSGGLDIKNADGMRHMKRDMSGGAAALAAISAVAALRLPICVKAILAATENMPDGNAYKPGDVLDTMAGLTVEVENTDAEGRLTLADAIAYAKRQGATRIVDIATLTNAIRGFGGDVGAGAFGNRPGFTSEVLAAAGIAGELLGELPMWEEFREANHSDMADLKNSGGDPGSVTAAWFLREFAGEEIPWVHLDIAGPSFRNRELGADPKGATGYGVRTLIELARRLSS